MTVSETPSVHKVYGIQSHEMHVAPIDELRNALVFDGEILAISWQFNQEPLDEFMKAIMSDKVFAIRWEQYFKDKTRPLCHFRAIRDAKKSKIIDDSSIEIMNDFISAGLSPGLSAFLTLISLDQDNPLTISDVPEILKTGAVIQMDSETCESTLEIISILRRQWEKNTVYAILSKFGSTLKQQQKMFSALSVIPEDASSVISNPEPSTLYFFIRFNKEIERLNYDSASFRLLITMLNRINSDFALKVEQIQSSWDKYQTVFMNSSTKTTPEKSAAFYKLVNASGEDIEGTNFDIAESIQILWDSMKYINFGRYESFDENGRDWIYEYKSLLFASVICAYGLKNISKTIDNHKNIGGMKFFQYLSLIEYEKDGTTADPYLVFSLFSLPEINS